MYRYLLSFLILCLGSLNASADNLDINLNDEAVRVIYGVDQGTWEAMFGVLYWEPDNGGSDILGHIGMNVLGGKSGKHHIEGRLGGNIYFANTDTVDIFALGLGGELNFFPNSGAVGIGFKAYYAPEIIAGGDIDQFTELGVRLLFQLFDSGSVYVGYREIEARHEASQRDFTLEDGVHAGLTLRF